MAIAEVLYVEYDQAFFLSNGKKINIISGGKVIDENNCGIEERNKSGYQTLQRVNNKCL